MALTVEDGSGVAGAESYLSVADADTYHTTWGNTAWTGTTTVKEVALRKATRYLDATYGARWQGVANTSTQGLDWPRSEVYDRSGYLLDNDALPQSLEDACAEMALRALTEDLQPDLSDTGTISSESVSVGPVSSSTTYVGGKSPVTEYRVADALVAELVSGGLAFGEIVRA